jgi:hypothetical protein
MYNCLYPQFNIRFFNICPACSGIPLLSPLIKEREDDLCDDCHYQRVKLLIKKWETEAALRKFPTEVNARKYMSLERRIDFVRLTSILTLLNERKSDNVYKAETLLKVSKKEARSRSNTRRSEAECSQRAQEVY